MTAQGKPAEARQLGRLRRICLTLQGATESPSGSHVTFRVKKKVFAYFLDNHHGDGIVALCIKTPRGENAAWIAHDPSRFYLPAYIGPQGWLGLRLDQGTVDWKEVDDFIKDSYRLATTSPGPARLAGQSRDSGRKN